MAENKGILIYGETGKERLPSITLELLGIGRKLADSLGRPLVIVFIDKNGGRFSQDAIAAGADTVYLIDDAPCEIYEGASYASIMEKLCHEVVRPEIVLFGQTLTGRDLAPRLAFRLGAGLVTDCIGLSIDTSSKQLVAKKPVAGGNVIATYGFKAGTVQLATVRCKAMDPMQPDTTRKGETHTIQAGIGASAIKAKIIRSVKQETEGPNLETAEIIVSGGRGIGTPGDFEKYLTQGLAKILGAAVGGTRAAVDSGLISEQHQVGLTGKIVGPNLYFAIALSGAIQHITGCSGSKCIVAINKDENAQIFNFARFGIVGDYRKVLPPLIERLCQVFSG